MSDIIPERINIQNEESAYRAAVSEATMTRVGASINHINYFQNKFFEFGFIKAIANSGNPTYNQFIAPLVISNFEEFEFGSKIIGVECQHNTSGSSGTTELDIHWSTQNSGSWASIFSTTPKVTSSAPSDAQFDTFGNATTPTGCTVPVLSKSTFDAGDRIRCRCVTTQSGTPNGFLLKLIYRPT